VSAQRSIDGVGSFEEYRARFTGTIDLEDDPEINATTLDQVSVGVVVIRTKDVQAKLGRDGVLARVGVLNVTDLRVVDGDLKDLLVERLGLYGGDTVEPARILAGTTGSDADANPAVDLDNDDDNLESWQNDRADSLRVSTEALMRLDDDLATDEDGEIIPGQLLEQPELPYEAPTVVGSIHDRSQRPQGSGMPNVAPFRTEDGPLAPASGQRIGRVGRQDEQLNSYLYNS
jgi:hypothetical protein